MGPKILLATTVRWPSTARLAASFSGVACVVDALAPEGHPVGQSRYVRVCHAHCHLRPQETLRGAIEQSQPDLIVPCDDRMVVQLVQLYRRLAAGERRGRVGEIIERSLGRPESCPILMARADAMAAAQERGIATPPTRVIRDQAELDGALSELGLPIAIKADGSWGGEGVVLAESIREARAAWREFARRSVVTAQQFVFGQLGTSAFACWQGRVLGAIHMEVVQRTKAAGPASVLRRVESAAMDRAARLLAQRFHLSGLHGLDFIRDGEGRAHLIEINPRATQIGPLALGPGRDLVAALASQVGPPVPERAPATSNDLIALFPQEWARDPASVHLGAAYHDVPWDDPGVLRACFAQCGPHDASFDELLAQLKGPARRPALA